MLTYCRVESRERIFPSFPCDHCCILASDICALNKVIKIQFFWQVKVFVIVSLKERIQSALLGFHLDLDQFAVAFAIPQEILPSYQKPRKNSLFRYAKSRQYRSSINYDESMICKVMELLQSEIRQTCILKVVKYIICIGHESQLHACFIFGCKSCVSKQ